MRNAARVGDAAEGICYQHDPDPIFVTGAISSGSGGTEIEGKQAARVGDTVTFSCGHVSYIVSGTSDATIDGRGIAHEGSLVDGPVKGIVIGSAGHTEVE